MNYVILNSIIKSLVPILTGGVLPIVMVWLYYRNEQLKATKRSETIMAVIEKNPEVDVQEFLNKLNPPKLSYKEKMLKIMHYEVLWGTICFIGGIVTISVIIALSILQVYIEGFFPIVSMFGIVPLAVGCGLLAAYNNAKKTLENLKDNDQVIMTREQFVELVNQEQAHLRRFLTALCCGNSAEADDIAQEALIKAYLRSSQYDERGQFSAWLMKIAYRVFIDSRRKQKRQQELPLEKAITLQGNSKSDEAFRYQELHTALATLSETMRTSILLYYMQGYQIKEIAEITENSEDAIKKQLSRGRQELKHILER